MLVEAGDDGLLDKAWISTAGSWKGAEGGRAYHNRALADDDQGGVDGVDLGCRTLKVLRLALQAVETLGNLGGRDGRDNGAHDKGNAGDEGAEGDHGCVCEGLRSVCVKLCVESENGGGVVDDDAEDDDAEDDMRTMGAKELPFCTLEMQSRTRVGRLASASSCPLRLLLTRIIAMVAWRWTRTGQARKSLPTTAHIAACQPCRAVP